MSMLLHGTQSRRWALGLGHWAFRAKRGRAFTLLEVLLTIALIALLGSVLVGGAAHLLQAQPVTPDDVFWKTVMEARKSALKAEHEMRLRYDKDKKRFLVVDGLAAAAPADPFAREPQADVIVKEFAVPPQTAGDLVVDFLPAGTKGGNLIVIGGVAVESQPIKYVTFYPDGTCTPFRAQFQRNGGSYTLSVDPWTCAAMLTPPDPNAPSL